MTEKVKVPQEVAEAIEKFRNADFGDYGIVNAMETVILDLENERMAIRSWVYKEGGANADRLLDALRIGYEVEPEYKVGDWVVMLGGLKFPYTDMLAVEVKNFGGHYITYFSDYGIDMKKVRHATQEEIKVEKERRWWAKHGRDVWELKQGDVLMATRRTIYEITADPKSHRFDCYTGNDERDFDIEECKRDNWEVICFHENRKDVRHA